MDEIEMKLYSLNCALDELRTEQITRELLYEAAQQGISPGEVIEALDKDVVIDAEVVEEPDTAMKIAAKAKRLLNYPVTRDDVLKAADEVAEVAKANNTTPEAVIKEVAKEHPKTTVKIKVFND